jgi:hypothetical protein
VPCLQVIFIGKRLPYVLAAVSADGFLRLWNVKQAQLVMEVQVTQDHGLTAVCVDPAQTLLVVSDSAGFMYTYNIAAWKGGKGKYQVCVVCCSSGLMQPCTSVVSKLCSSCLMWAYTVPAMRDAIEPAFHTAVEGAEQAVLICKYALPACFSIITWRNCVQLFKSQVDDC